MKPRIPYILFLLLAIASRFCLAQDKNSGALDFSGIVYGNSEAATGRAIKKNKKLALMEGLSGVIITAYENDRRVYSVRSDQKGEFLLTLKLDHLYTLELSKKKYATSTLMIDTRDIPSRIGNNLIPFSGAEFILTGEAEGTASNLIGTLYYNKYRDYFDFQPNAAMAPNTKMVFIRSGADNESELMKDAVLKNKNNTKNLYVTPPEKKREDNRPNITSVFGLGPAKEIEFMSDQDIQMRKEEIRLAKLQLEQDKLKMLRHADSLIIRDREARIAAAEVELKNAIKLLELQKEEIKNKNQLLVLSINSLVVLAVLLSVVFFLYRGKRKVNRILATKNDKITDSINYAKRIQESILKYENEIRQHFPNSFIYSRPKDIVSGDFFWFSRQGEKYFAATIDCTGHGVPGAFMSLVGNTLLNEIINQKQVHTPALILEHLNDGVSKILRQEGNMASLQDGMDLALCVIDTAEKTIEYSGALNPLYFVQDNFLQVRKADSRSIGGISLRKERKNDARFTNHRIPLKKNTSIYLFTDGYVDQFGGFANTKFSTTQFRELLMQIQQSGMEEQKERIHEAFETWKGTNRQIDDAMVVGIRI